MITNGDKSEQINLRGQDATMEEKWITYFRRFGYGVSILKGSKLRKLVREGIPNNLRGNNENNLFIILFFFL